MFSGNPSDFLTENQRHILEERTALFINLTGMVAQQAPDYKGGGVSTRHLYKLLANTILDWHNLPILDPPRYLFEGPADLVWTPHHFGALGMVLPRIKYEAAPRIKLKYGLYPSLEALFLHSQYIKYGASIYQVILNKNVLIQFPHYIEYASLEKGPVEAHERHYWEILTQIYSRVPDETLDCLASCRSEKLYHHSLLIQLVFWKEYANRALLMLIEGVSNDNVFEQGIVRSYLSAAHACAAQLTKKMRLFEERHIHRKRVSELSMKTEFGSTVPVMDADSKESSRVFQDPEVLDKSVQLTKDLDLLLSGVTRRWEHHVSDVDFKEIGLAVCRIKELGINPELAEPRRWQALFIDGPPRDCSLLAITLIEEAFEWMSANLAQSIMEPGKHYRNFMSNMYPLPKGHFKAGN